MKAEDSTYHTTDTLFNKRFKIIQSKDGYRFSIDPVLLAHHLNPGKNSKILDIGTGCGIIPMIISYRHREARITGIEIQEPLEFIARQNITANKLEKSVTILKGDIKSPPLEIGPSYFDIVVTNPPYTKKGSGRVNPDSQKAAARHEINITLKKLLKASAKALKPAGEFLIIYPSQRLAELLSEMRYSGIEPRWMRAIHPYLDSDSKLIIVSGVKNGGEGFIIKKPLYIYDGDEYSNEVSSMFAPNPSFCQTS